MSTPPPDFETRVEELTAELVALLPDPRPRSFARYHLVNILLDFRQAEDQMERRMLADYVLHHLTQGSRAMIPGGDVDRILSEMRTA